MGISMGNDYYSTFTTFTELGGEFVPLRDLCSNLSSLPLDGTIGFLATLSRHLACEGIKTIDPRWQAPYLNKALVDDFPCTLRNAARLVAPGRVPDTGGRALFIHQQNLAILAHLGVLHCHEATPSYRFTEPLKQRLCRLLLVVNDYLNVPGPDISEPTLIERKEICIRWLRLHEFGIETPFMRLAFYNTARQRKLCSLIQNRNLYDIEGTFIQSANGVKLGEMYQFHVILLATVYKKLGRGAIWLPRSLMHTPTAKGAQIIESLAAKWIRTPEQYQSRFKELTGQDSPSDLDDALDVRCLRESPLIAGRTDSVACPCLPFLRDLPQNTPYYLILDNMDDEREKSRFQNSLGKGFELYTEELIERMAAGDNRGPWQVHHRVPGRKQGTEIADSILYRDRTAFVIEHKGQRPGSEFLSGRSGDLVLGPSNHILTEIMSGREFDRVKAKREDKGMLTHGMWQQSANGDEILQWIKDKHGLTPTRLYSIIMNLYGPRMDRMVRGVYVDKLVSDAELYSEDYWARPQWLLVTDLEALAALADEGKLDLEKLFEKKEKSEISRSQGFDQYLSEEFQFIPPDRKLAEYGMSQAVDSQVFFREESDQ